jgi:hypothetical protein
MESVVSLVVASLALVVAALTAWLTLLKRATVKMTQPTVIYFGPDGSRTEPGPTNKVFLRTLLYATARRGCIVESMFVRLRRGESTQNFNIWVYGESRLSRGSGLFISDAGVTTNHHFLLPFDDTAFAFNAGAYTVQLFASVVGEKTPRMLTSIPLTVLPDQSVELRQPKCGLYFDWSPDASEYRSHVRHDTWSDQRDFERHFGIPSE